MSITINADTIAIICAVISLIAMLVSISQAHIAKRSLKIQQQIYDDGKPNFRIKDILDSYAIISEDSEYVKLMFYPLITNLSDKPMIIERIRLRLVGEKGEVFLTPCISSEYIYDGYTISGNSSDSKWTCFQVSKKEYTDLKLIKHTLVLHDAYQNSDEKSIVWVKEMVTTNEKMD